MHSDIPPHYQDLLKDTIKPFSDFSTIDFIDTQDELSNIWQNLGFRGHFAKEFLYKLILADYFPQFDKIIVSDCDVVFLGDVSESFLAFCPDSDYYIAGVKNNNPDAIFPLTGWKEGYKKFSDKELKAIQNGVGGGYLIANLKKWRRDNIQSKLTKYALENAKKLILAEQDVLNIICYPKIATLTPAHIVSNASWEIWGESWERLSPQIYTQKEINEARINPIQLHYVGHKKPWNSPNTPKSEIWYKYLVKTPFLKIFLSNIERTIIANHEKKRLSYRIKNLYKTNPLFFVDIAFYGKIARKIRARFANPKQ